MIRSYPKNRHPLAYVLSFLLPIAHFAAEHAMSAQRTDLFEPRPFSVLGISEQEERIYRWLLMHPRASAAEAARALSLSSAKAQHQLDAIEAKGLATHSPERMRRYIPLSPDIAMETLILHRQNDLQRARNAAQELQEQTAIHRQSEQDLIVELIASREAEHQIYDQVHRSAQHEVNTLIRLPVLISRLDVSARQDHRYQREAQARGVHYRSVADTDYMALPGAVQRTREDMEAGEEVRVISHLPFKMVLFDRRLAFIPLDLERSDRPTLLIRSSALLDALYVLFEILWERSAPISFTRTGTLKVNDLDSQLPNETEDIISLMVAGLNDKKIAGELGISVSTLTRRISEIMKAFNARTRFQLGCLITRPLPDHDSK